jgi:hypothetical protein
MNEIVPHIRPITEEIAAITAAGPSNAEDRLTIGGCKGRLVKGVAGACETVRITLKVYDDAYTDLTKNGQPLAFRDFLMKAPMLFYELGERLAALQHVVSFWRFRFPPGQHGLRRRRQGSLERVPKSGNRLSDETRSKYWI